METSVALSDMSLGGNRRHGLDDPTLIRVGVSEVLELRWESDWLVREEVTPAAGASSTVTGLADFSLGLKWHGGTLGAVGFGASYRVSAFWQLDTALSLGLNDRSTDVGLTVGNSGLVVR